MSYLKMTNEQKAAFFQKEYIEGTKSFCELAKEQGTYTNRLRRDALALNIPIRGKAAAQSVALKSGRATHPTEGTERPYDVRVQISEKRADAWDLVTKEERKIIAARAREQFHDMTPEQKEVFFRKASQAVRKAAKEGSKLENHIKDVLINAGYHVEFHKEHVLLNEKLQIDLYLPRQAIAIEIDGPSHWLPIWGTKTLQRNKRADNEKNGLLLSRGMVVIRVQQDGPLSEKFKRDKAAKLLKLVEDCVAKKPDKNNRYFEL